MDYSIEIADKLLQVEYSDELFTVVDLYSDFYAKLNILKTTQRDIGVAWTIYSPDLYEDFWATIEINKKRNLSSEFWAKLILRKSVGNYRIHTGIGGRGVAYISGPYTPLAQSSDRNINIEFDYLTVTDNKIDFSISITNIQCNKISIKLVSRENDKVTSVDPQNTRQFIYKEDISNLSSTKYFRTEYKKKTFSNSISIQDSFIGLQDGHYEIVVTCWQADSGNIYIGGDHFKIGGQIPDINVSSTVQQGLSPLSVQFNSSLKYGGNVSYIIWEFEPGVTKVLPNTESGRNPIYQYKNIGYHYPTVTYVMSDGYKISRGLTGVYQEAP